MTPFPLSTTNVPDSLRPFSPDTLPALWNSKYTISLRTNLDVRGKSSSLWVSINVEEGSLASLWNKARSVSGINEHRSKCNKTRNCRSKIPWAEGQLRSMKSSRCLRIRYE
ncbi:uncharacterized protein LY89DRAFT_185842 [Mollisia scopiformis]|uniref:Uncharacterized protein n=1 Tax=Mollisia scopiformis TaxID=149040 RepID=A0A194XTB7_MOLSC|nr:uncharacterized protein LY89DRAFT_185842 [Mollisia scopiformis]KUJ23560.1 hypothetical protein LY89DRAFT_185842 [Mollisia scopiformis]